MNEEKKVCCTCSVEHLTPSMLINDVHRLTSAKIRRESERSGLRQGYRRIMFHLSHGDDGGTQQDLVRHTKLSAPTVSVSLARMEAEGLVRRRPDENDLRVIRVSLTEKGKQLNQRMQELFREIEDDIGGELTEDEMAELKGILLKIRNRLIERTSANDEEDS
jgi:DNA-binding MarR family transcriptional regulator